MKKDKKEKKFLGIPLANWIITLVGYSLAFGFGWLLNITEIYQWGKGITWVTGVMVGWIFGIFASALIESRKKGDNSSEP